MKKTIKPATKSSIRVERSTFKLFKKYKLLPSEKHNVTLLRLIKGAI